MRRSKQIRDNSEHDWHMACQDSQSVWLIDLICDTLSRSDIDGGDLMAHMFLVGTLTPN